MTNPSSTTRSSMFIKWSCPLSHGRRLDALVARKLATIERVIEGKRLLFRTVGMLTKLVERFDSYRTREDEEPRDEDEDENDHEDE
jgi:hypothetical protein